MIPRTRSGVTLAPCPRVRGITPRQGCRFRDGSAFASLYETYERPIFNYVLRLLGDRHEAGGRNPGRLHQGHGQTLPELDLDQFEFAPYLYTAARERRLRRDRQA